MANSCEHVLQVTGAAADRAAICRHFFNEEATGLPCPDGAHLAPMTAMTSMPWKIWAHDDGAILWVYWDMRRLGPQLVWCEWLSRLFPDATVRVNYLYECDLGAGQLRWHAGEILENVELIDAGGSFEEVTSQFYALVSSF